MTIHFLLMIWATATCSAMHLTPTTAPTTNHARVAKNDKILYSVMDLIAPGKAADCETHVADDGTIHLSLIAEPLKVVDLSEEQLGKAIAEAYLRAGLLPGPVRVTARIEKRSDAR